MSTGTTAVDRLEAVGVETRRVERAAFADAVADVVDDPAVGVALSGYDVSLADAPVTVDPTGAELKAAATGVTPAACCIVDYGSLVLPENGAGSEQVSLFVDHHVAVLREGDVVPDMETAFERFDEDVREASTDRILATGPSATADMGELVIGAHGPERVTAVVLTD